MAGTIGIKIANGNFFPILEESRPAKKRLVLTTAHDRQGSVQVDLFRSISKSMLDAQYIGSLVIEDIRPRPKEEPSIEMDISIDGEGNITAEAFDMEASPDSDHHVLSVSLRTMDALTSPDDFPDFDVEGARPARMRRGEGSKKRKFPWGILIAAILLALLGIAALWLFMLGGREMLRPAEGRPAAEAAAPPPAALPPPPEPPPPASAPPEAAPPALAGDPAAARPPAGAPALAGDPGAAQIPAGEAEQAAPESPAAQPETVAMPASPPPPPVAISPPVIQAPAAPPPPPRPAARGSRPPAPVLAHRVPAVIPPNGVVYQIRWGDTLWDISAAFYRDPLLYPRIARHNSIRNPNLILAGFNVRIPPLN